MRCDIILPVCDQFEFTKACIESIIAGTDTPYRLIVINNGKNEMTRAYLEKVKGRLGDALVVVKNDTNIGWVKALNQGIAISDAPYLCFQNDDTVVTRGWLRKMIRILEDNKDIVERIKVGKEYTDRMGVFGFVRDVRDIQAMVFQNEEYVDEEKMNKIHEILAEAKKKVASVIFE